jgi:hypothetical protein
MQLTFTVVDVVDPHAIAGVPQLAAGVVECRAKLASVCAAGCSGPRGSNAGAESYRKKN